VRDAPCPAAALPFAEAASYIGRGGSWLREKTHMDREKLKQRYFELNRQAPKGSPDQVRAWTINMMLGRGDAPSDIRKVIRLLPRNQSAQTTE
jgi:hypothetical protein